VLTRPGSQPGPERMRKLSTSPEGPRQLREAIPRILVLFSVIQVASIVVADVAVYRAHGRHGGTWRVLAIGGVSARVIAFGPISVGGFGIAFGDHQAGGKQKESLFG